MCGISGIVDFNKMISKSILDEMIQTLHHRGPNNHNSIIIENDSYYIGLSHARLSIIDLSESANQPMVYENYHIVFNGEIYNFREIREELIHLGHVFILDSDTEVILHAFAEWGTKCVDRFIGMFAFVIYDKDNRKIYLFRDRAGVKPIYYYYDEDLFLFASELKAICKHPSFKKEIDNQAVALYFKLGTIPSPYSIYKKTLKLKPGHWACLNLDNKTLILEKYWDAQSFYEQDQLNLSYEEAKNQLHSLLKSACQYRMIADVPVGIFLSGGYDSTIVASILQKNTISKLKTFTIGFEEGNNEAPFAKDIAAHIGTDHTEFICTTAEAKELIPQLSFYYDEPFSDSSAIPTMLVSKLAGQKVTVVLSADAGDEQFCGYNSYPLLEAYLKKVNKMKPLANKASGSFLQLASVSLLKKDKISHKLYSLGQMFKKESKYWVSMLHEGMQSAPEKIIEKLLVDRGNPIQAMLTDDSLFHDQISVANLLDYQNYLPNDILVKVDRATMSASIEGREPLLDHRVLEFAARLPMDYKYDGKIKKKILKDIAYEYVPKEIMDRPKTGFTLPIYSWLKGDLSYLLDEYLSRESLKSTKIFNVDFTLELLNSFRNNKLRDESIIWKILQFQMWHRCWIN